MGFTWLTNTLKTCYVFHASYLSHSYERQQAELFYVINILRCNNTLSMNSLLHNQLVRGFKSAPLAMSYEEMQAEKGFSYTIALPRIRWPRSISSRTFTYFTLLALVLVWFVTPIGHLTTPFFATHFFHYPFTTFNTREIASLTTEFYELLSQMGQFAPATIKYPPHLHPSINVKFAKSLGMAPQVVDLIQKLPYVESNGRIWLFEGIFADFREDEDLESSRDPFSVNPDGWSYYSERGPYMRPWQVALNAAGNHGAVLLLDTWTSKSFVTASMFTLD